MSLIVIKPVLHDITADPSGRDHRPKEIFGGVTMHFHQPCKWILQWQSVSSIFFAITRTRRCFHAGSLALLLCAASISASAQFAYQSSNGTAIITAYTGPGGVVVVPERIDGL